MKKTFQFTLGFLLLFAFCTIYAQQTVLSTGKAPSTKNMSHVNYGTFPLADIAYANDNSTSNNISMPIPAGNPFTVIGNFTAPNFAASMVKGGDDNFYLIDIAPALYLFDPGSGSCTLIGNITGMGGDQPNGISYNPADDSYYMVSSAAFYKLDINTLNATLVGSFTPAITGLMIDLCFDENGVCYAYDVDINPGAANGYIIDINTAALTTLGYVGFTPNYGQGMSYDMETGTIYLSAFNSDTFSGQLRTMDKTTGMTTLLYDWGDQIAPFAVNTNYGPPCPVDAASDPNPPSGTIDVSVDGTTLTWTNGAGTTNIEVWFGPVGNVTQVYSGAPITSWPTGALEYFTTYNWRVVDRNDTCAAGQTATWNFKTVLSPGVLLIDPFDDMSGWTIVGPLGLTNWLISNTNFAGGVSAPELEFSWSPSFVGASYFLSNPITVPTGHNCEFTFTNYVNFYAVPCGPIGVAVTTDGGATYTSIFETSPTATYGPQVETIDFVGTDGMQLAFYYNGDSFNINFWYMDDAMLVDMDFIPVELTSFRADVNDGNVALNWSTVTEKNNKGFEVQRNSGNGFEVIGFVDGNGTTTQVHNYSYVDNKVQAGNYTYRLRQVDFDGASNYSKSVEVKVEVPKVYALEQNYPNPFNPSTQINFSLASDSKVTLTVFNILGQNIATILNGNMTAGSHNVTFNAANLPSGVYMYRIEAKGIDGNSFTSVKKMMLTK